MFGVLLLLVLMVVFAAVADGGIDSKALAMLGVLSAVEAGLRPLGAGTAGIETVFFVLVLAGRVFGPGFGFALGCTSLFASALLTGGVGPWAAVPDVRQRLGGHGRRAAAPRSGQGRAAHARGVRRRLGLPLRVPAQPVVLAVLARPRKRHRLRAGPAFAELWRRYLVFDATTSLGWDTGRAVTNLVLVLVTGPALLAVLRRAARRAAFRPPWSSGRPPTTGLHRLPDEHPTP